VAKKSIVDRPVAKVYIVIPPTSGKNIIASINLMIVVLIKVRQKFGRGIDNKNSRRSGVGYKISTAIDQLPMFNFKCGCYQQSSLFGNRIMLVNTAVSIFLYSVIPRAISLF
jgi:hypothetical protein